jgi:hypothetical protein
LVYWALEVATRSNVQPVFAELLPLKVNMAALPLTGTDGIVREALTKASVEFVATETLNMLSFEAVNRSLVNSGLVAVVENW